MEHINKVQLRGRIGYLRLRQINDTTVANFSVAVSETFKKRDGSTVTTTQYVNCAAWESLDRPIHSLQQGCDVEVNGRIVNRRYTDRDGVERSITEVKADNVKVLGYPEPAAPATPGDMPDDIAF